MSKPSAFTSDWLSARRLAEPSTAGRDLICSSCEQFVQTFVHISFGCLDLLSINNSGLVSDAWPPVDAFDGSYSNIASHLSIVVSRFSRTVYFW